MSNIAQINTRAIYEYLDLAIRNNQTFDILESRQNKQMDMHENPFVGGITQSLRDNGIKISDDLYYMLVPKNLQGITGKVNSSKELFRHVINSAWTANMGRNTPISAQRFKKFSVLRNFREALNGNATLQNGATITASDIETIGGGADKYGLQKIYGIYDYSFINVDQKGQSKKFTGLIGVRSGDKADVFLSELLNKLENGVSLDDLDSNEKVSFEYISRLGNSTDFVTKENGRWINSKLVSDENGSYKTLENFKKGFEKLKEIGTDQIQQYGSLGGYRQFMDDINTFHNPNNLFLGHNYVKFDSYVIKNMIGRDSEFRNYAKSIGLDYAQAFSPNNIIDTKEMIDALGPTEKAKIAQTFYPNGVQKFMGDPNATEFQLETLHALEFGKSADPHHNADFDANQSFDIVGIHVDKETGQVTTQDTKFIKNIEEKLLDQYQSGTYQLNGKNFGNTSQPIDNLTGKDVLVVPKRNLGFSNASTDQNVFYTVTNGNNTYYSNGMMSTIDPTTGKIKVQEQEAKFFPSFMKNRMGYTIDPESFKLIDDTKIMEAISYGRTGLEGSQRVYTFTMKPYASDHEKYLNKSNAQIQVFVAEDQIEDYFHEHFNFVQVGDKTTEQGRYMLSQMYQKGSFSDENTKNGWATFKNELVNDPRIALSGNQERVTLENISRGMSEGRFNSVERGLAIRHLIDHGKIQLDDFNEALSNLSSRDPKAIEKFMNIVSGINLDQSLESYVNTSLNGDYRDSKTWLNLWTINGVQNNSWADNSIYMARHIDPNSIGANLVQEMKMRQFTPYQKKRAFNQLIMEETGNAIKDEVLYSKIYGVTPDTADWRLQSGQRHLLVDRFRRQYLPQNTKLNSSFMTFNSSNPTSVFNSIFRSIGRNSDNLTQKEQASIVNNFIWYLNDTYTKAEKNNQSEEFLSAQSELKSLWKDKTLTPKDKAKKLAYILNDQPYFQQDQFLPPTIPTNIANSSLFQRVKDNESSKKIINGIIDDVSKIQEPKILTANELVTQHLLGGTKEEFVERFQEGLKPANLSRKDLTEIKAVMNMQLESTIKFGKNLVETLERSGGHLTKDTNGRMMVDFGGMPIDITQYLPQLVSNGNGVTYTQLGATSYTTKLNGRYTQGGALDVRTMIDRMANRTFYGLSDSLEAAKKLGERKEDVFMRHLKRGAKEVYEKTTNASAGLKADLVGNFTMDYSKALIDKNQREDFLTYLLSKKNPSESIKTLISELSKNRGKDLERISDKTFKALTLAWEEGSVPAYFDVNYHGEKVRFGLTGNIKDTIAQQGNIGVKYMPFGDSMFSGSPSSVGEYVEQSAIAIPENRLEFSGRQYSGGIKTANDIITSHVNGVKINNHIRTSSIDINAHVRDQLISNAVNSGQITEFQAVFLSTVIQPREGGGAISGRLIEDAGYREGRKVVNLTHKEVLENTLKDENKFKSTKIKIVKNEISGFSIKYSKGFAVGKNSTFLRTFSQFDGEAREEAPRASIITQKYVLGEGKDMVLNEQEANNIIYNLMEKENKHFNTPEEFQKYVDSKLHLRLVADPITLPNTVKVKDTFGEKHELVTVIGRLSENQDEAVQKFLKSKEVAKVNKFLGINIGEVLLTDDIVKDIESRNFQSPIWDVLKDEEKDNLKEVIDGINFDALSVKRYQTADLLTKTFSAETVFQSIKDMYKHKDWGREVSYIFNEIAKAKGPEEALRIFNEAFKLNFSLNPDNSLRVPDGDFSFSLDTLSQIAKENNVSMPDINTSYDGFVSFIRVPQEMGKRPKFDERTFNSLKNQVYDNTVINRVHDNMVKDGTANEETFKSIFEDILDENYLNGKGELKIKDKYDGVSVWSNKAFTSNLYNLMGKDETLFDPNKTTDSRRKKIAAEAKEKFGTPYISEEFVNEVAHAQDVKNAVKLQKQIYEGENPESLLGFTNIEADDFSYDYKGRREEYITDKNAGWKKNAIIDLKDAESGLDDDFFKSQYSKSKLVVPGYDPEVFEKRGEVIFGQDVHLREYQKKASSILSSRERIQKYNKLYNSATSDADRELYKKQLDSEKNYLTNAISDYNEYFVKKYATNVKEGGVLYERMNKSFPLANRSIAQVFDTDAWILNPSDKATFGSDLKYQGKNLRELWRNNKKVSFTIASTGDLAKYGFTDEYFKKNNIDKKAWLERAKTEGIEALVHRDPNDYHGSTIATQLYFSDNINSGVVMTDYITSAQLKQDSDGDTVATYVLGYRNRSGQYINVNSGDSKNAAGLKNLHRQSMAINTLSYRTDYMVEGSEKYRKTLADTDAQRQEVIKRKQKSLSDLVDNTIDVTSKYFHDDATRNRLTQEWTETKKIANPLIQKFNLNPSNDTISEMGYHEHIKTLIAQHSEDISKEQVKALKSGLKSHTSLILPTATYLSRVGRNTVGEIDTPFNVIDTIKSFLTDRRTSELVENRIKLSDAEIQALDYIKESPKEGFLTSKKSDFEVLKKERQMLPDTTRGYIDTIIKSRGNDQDAINGLIHNLQVGGRNVVERNNPIQILGEEGYNEIKRKAAAEVALNGGNVDDVIETMAHNASVVKGVQTFVKSVKAFTPEFTQDGIYGIYRGHMLQALNSMIDPMEEVTAKQKAMILDHSAEYLTEVRNEVVRDQQEFIQDVATDTSTVKNLHRLRKLDPSDDMGLARNIVNRKMSSGWGKNMLFFAASIFALGYVGGNPASAPGREANDATTQHQYQQNYISPIPQQRDSSLNITRKGPRQGYIINIQGSTMNNNNDYVGASIAQAVRENYQNSQINVNVTTQEQTDITYNQVYDYVEQSIF